MRRATSLFRAQLERILRPGPTLILALGLLAPAAFLPLGGAAVPETEPRSAPAVAATAGSDSTHRRPGDPAAEAWQARTLGRRQAELARRFAREFGIPTDLAHQIYSVALQENVEPSLAFGLVRTESSFRRTAVSFAGAVGYTQVLPSTAGWLRPGTTRRELFHPRTNLTVGFRYLHYLLDRYDGDVRLALTAYNRGPGTVDRLLKKGIAPFNGYARKVLAGA